MDFFLFIKDWWFLITALVGATYGFYQGMRTINDTLVSIKHELELSNNRLEASARDRQKIWSKIESHSRRLYKVEEDSVRHEERLNHLEKRE